MLRLDAVSKYKERRASRLGANAIWKYKARRDERILARFDDDEENNAPSHKGSGNTRIPFGLCQREGIDIDPKWTPKDAWEALAGKGYSAGEVYKELKATGKVPAKPSAPKTSKADYDKAVKAYDNRTKEYNKAVKANERASKALNKAIAERASVSSYIAALRERVKYAEARGDEDLKKTWTERIEEEQKKYDEANAKAEKAQSKKDEAQKKLSDAENGYEEIKASYKKAIKESPEYEKAKEGAKYDDRIRLIENIAKEKEDEVKKLSICADRYNRFADEAEQRAKTEGKEGWKAIYEQDAKSYRERARRFEEQMKEAALEAKPYREAIDGYKKKVSEIKGDSDDDAWNRARDLDIEERTVKEGEYTDIQRTVDSMRRDKVKYESVRKYAQTPSEDGIIKYISGGDETHGSCVSVAMAYAANKAGYEVLDFRGGDSQQVLSIAGRGAIAQMGGETIVKEKDIDAAHEAFNRVQEGKEYWLAVGHHASIVRKRDGQVEYLELQSHSTNGWKPLNDDVLKNRFACRVRKSKTGALYKCDAVIADIETLAKHPDFIQFCGYINTAEDKQKRGSSGGIK